MKLQAEGLYPEGDIRRLTGEVVIGHDALRSMLVGQTIAALKFSETGALEFVLSNGAKVTIEAGGSFPEEATVDVIVETDE